MNNLKIVSAVLADSLDTLPPATMYEYAVAGNGLFIRAECAYLKACLPVAPAACPGLVKLNPSVKLKATPVPFYLLETILTSARRQLPDEAAYHLLYDGEFKIWTWVRPGQIATPGSVDYIDRPDALVDLHSHAALPAFFSATDDQDECGFRLYVVIGEVDTPHPTLAARVGVYGHRMRVPAMMIFESLGLFVEVEP